MEILLIGLSILLFVGLSAFKTSNGFAHGYVERPFSRAFRYSNARGTGSTAMIGAVASEPQSLGGRVNWPNGPGSPQDGRLASGNCAVWMSTCPQPIDRQTATLWDKNRLNVGWNDFHWHYTAPHRTASWEFYITRNGWNPDAPLTRAQFDLTPIYRETSNGASPRTSTHRVFIPTDKTGYHVIYATWNRSDANEAFYQVIDVELSGGTPTTPPPTPGPEIPPTPEVVPPASNVPDFNYAVVNMFTQINNTSAMDASLNNPGRIHLQPSNSTNQSSNQAWLYTLDPAIDAYTIQNRHPNLFGQYLVETANNQLGLSQVATANAYWKVTPVAGTTNQYYVSNLETGNRINVTNGASTTGTIIGATTPANIQGQRWRFNVRELLAPPTPEPELPAPPPVDGITPTYLRVFDQTPNSVTLGWNEPLGLSVTAYELFRNGVKLADINGSETTFVDTTVTPGNTYTYTVRAVGNSLPSDAVVGTTLPIDIPGEPEIPVIPEPPFTNEALQAPSNLRVTHKTPTTISLAWDTPYDTVAHTGYEIFRDGVSIGNVAGNLTTFTDNDLLPNTTHTYTVKSHAYSLYSNQLTERTEGGFEPEHAYTFRLTGTGGSQQLILTNHTMTTLPAGWRLDFNFTGFNPTVHAPAVSALGVGGTLSTTVTLPLGSHDSVSIPVTVAVGNANLSNVRVDDILAVRET